MNKMKKLLALLLAAVLCLGMATVAMAANDDGSYNLSIKTVANHTYKIYQLATGTVSENGETLSNIAVGANAAANTSVTDITALVSKTGTELGEAAVALVDVNSSPIAIVVGDGSTKTVTLAGGYYVVVDSFTNSDAVVGNDVESPVMVEIVKDTTMTPKATGTPVDDKKIDEGEDGATASGKYSVGDDVPFVLTATMPSSIAVYNTYKLEFVDTLSDGLTLNQDSIQVFVDDSETAVADTAYTFTKTEKGFTVSFADVKAAPINAGEGTVIKVKYTAKLNEAAEETNVETNKSHINYSNNPESTGTGETDDKEVKVFHFSFDINKVDGETKEPLSGAGFTLYKWNEKAEGEDKYELVEEIAAEDGKTTFNFKGLGEGQYKLVESTTPDGYNTMVDVEFQIVPVIDEATGTVSSLKATKLDGTDLYPGDATTYSIAATITNDKGTNLPSTGGIGTTIFYVIGGILVVGAGVLLITKKRMSHNG